MIPVLVIGAGNVSDSHVKGYLALSDRVRVAGIVDTDPARANALAARHGLSVPVYADLQDALAKEKPGLVSVCTPPSTHRDLAIACLDAGANVLLEKPMAASLAECDDILAAAKRNGRFVSVVAQSRFITATRNVKRLLDDGLCGRLLYAQAYSAWWRGACYHDLDYRGRWATEGGGCTLGHAVHHIDLLLWMAGMPSEITAVMSNLAHNNSEEEDLSMALLRFPGGALGQITTSLVHHGEPQQMLFETEKAGIAIPYSVQCSKSLPNGFPEPDADFAARVKALYDSFPALEREGHSGQIEDVIAAIEKGAAPLITGVDGRNAIEVIMAIYKSAVSHQPVALPIAKDDPFYTKAGMLAAMPHFFEKTKSVASLGSGPISLAGDRLR